MTSDRTRFDLSAYPLPKNAQGKTFFDKSPGYLRIKRAFRQLVDDPGLGVLTAEAGVGKTAAFRNLCGELPRPDHLVLYLCDTSVSPLDLYRTLADELGLRPSHRRGQLWADIKKALVHMVDERATIPLVILDEAQHLSDDFLLDLGGFLNIPQSTLEASHVFAGTSSVGGVGTLGVHALARTSSIDSTYTPGTLPSGRVVLHGLHRWCGRYYGPLGSSQRDVGFVPTPWRRFPPSSRRTMAQL